ncbi:MAG: IS1595 family transposase [Alistipes sp.]|nr:IS1595 family transposase [Alistipes sp.]
MIILSKFNSLFELIRTFSDEEKCIEYLEQIRWKDGVISPFDSTSKVYKCSKGYWCKKTNKMFNVKTKTIFENTKIPLQKWFMAIWLITSHKKGISSLQLSKDINVTQKTGWFILQRIRKCFEMENHSILHNEVEVDETYIGGRERNKNPFGSHNGTQGRSTKTKTPVIGMVERKGKLVAHIIPDAKSISLTPAVLNVVDRSATIYTDEWKGYIAIDKLYNHSFVKHKDNEFVNGKAYTNTIECFWGLLKRGLLGIYHNSSKKHLQMYIDEFVFRYNTRKLNESDRFNILLSNITNRLRYSELIGSLI